MRSDSAGLAVAVGPEMRFSAARLRRVLLLACALWGGRIVAARGAEPPPWDMMIVGGGPAGIFAALETDRRARAAGLAAPRILVLERREQKGTRSPSVGVGTAALDATANVGVEWAATDLQRISGVLDERQLGEHWIPILSVKFRRRALRPRAPSGLVRQVLGRQGYPRTTVPIMDAEGALRAAAARHPNIAVRYQTPLEPAAPVERVAGLWQLRAGGRTERTRFLVAADGAHSADHGLAFQLGVRPTVPAAYEGLRTSWVVGQVARRPDADTLMHQRRLVDPQSGRLHKASLLPGRHASDGIAIELPEADPLASGDLEAYWRSHLPVFGIPDDAEAVVPPRRLDVELRRADRVVVAGSAFVIGDAARTIHPSRAAGLQTAWVVDAANLADCYVAAARSPIELGRAVRRFERRSRQATEVLQAQSVPLFPLSPRRQTALEHAQRVVAAEQRRPPGAPARGLFSLSAVRRR
jgi:2-polyprenyl-6-methoxyphenol hydroxylase-like FAD-dependent oxidoreductase